MTEEMSIPQYFARKNIFVTGATGFIGKALVEKLLRSCPDVGTIYLLIRPKKGSSPWQRVKAITDAPLFDILKKQRPENLKKIVPVNGDIVDLGLGMSDDDADTLIKKVNIVYHVAASVRFDDSLKDAVIMNTRGTREVVELCKKMKRLDVLLYYSTMYCNTDRLVVDAQIYPSIADWRETIELVEKADPYVLQALEQKYIHPLPNTYTFSKQLAEHVVNDLCDGQIPVVIGRPSIVTNTMMDPVPGWIDTFNGPAGNTVASGKGVLRTMYADPDLIADYIPCDIVVKGSIIATWKKGNEKGLVQDKSQEDTPPKPSPDFQLVKIQRKIYIAYSVLEYFMFNEWVFLSTEAVAMEDLLLPCDQKDFGYHKDSVYGDVYTYASNTVKGDIRYLLKEGESARVNENAQRMWLIGSQFFNGVWYFIGLFILLL